MITIVLPRYNDGEYTIRCIESIWRTDNKCDLIVADDASPETDIGLIWLKERAKEGKLKLLLGEKRLGAPRNFNRAVPKEGHVVKMDSEIIIYSGGWLDSFLKILDDNPKVGCVSAGMMAGPEVNSNLVHGPWRIDREKDGKILEMSEIYKWPTPPPYPLVKADLVPGCFQITRREAIDDLGEYLNSEYFYMTDTDFCLRMREKGWGLLYDGSIRSEHRNGLSARPDPVYHHNRQGDVEKFTKRWGEWKWRM